MRNESHWRDLNPRPHVYKTCAIPLGHSGDNSGNVQAHKIISVIDPGSVFKNAKCTVAINRAMKVFVYNYRRFDEEEFFLRYAERFGFELDWTEESPTVDNCILARGCDFISVITTPITAEMIDRFMQAGVRLISTRTIGYDHIDLEHAKNVGMAVTHVTYDPAGVAEYTVMGMLMCIRRMKSILRSFSEQDFRLDGNMGGELGRMTVGIIGLGRIGSTVVRDLSGFGCRVLCWNRSGTKPTVNAEMVGLDRLLSESDVISLHLELNDETRHFLDSKAFSKMKKGVIIVNTARGPLIDTDALISELESGKIGQVFLDVVEDEFGLYYNDCRGLDLSDRYLGRLKNRPEVIVTHHMAFYYRTAVDDMVYNSLLGMKRFSEGTEPPFRIA